MLDEPSDLGDPPGEDPDWPFLLSAGERRSFTANTILRDPAWRDWLLRFGTLSLLADGSVLLAYGSTARAVYSAVAVVVVAVAVVAAVVTR